MRTNQRVEHFHQYRQRGLELLMRSRHDLGTPSRRRSALDVEAAATTTTAVCAASARAAVAPATTAAHRTAAGSITITIITTSTTAAATVSVVVFARVYPACGRIHCGLAAELLVASAIHELPCGLPSLYRESA